MDLLRNYTVFDLLLIWIMCLLTSFYPDHEIVKLTRNWSGIHQDQ